MMRARRRRNGAPGTFEGDAALPDGRLVRFEATADGALLRLVDAPTVAVRLRDASEQALDEALAELLAAAPPALVAPTFADKVETFAQTLNGQLRSLAKGRDVSGSFYEVEPSRQYWYLRSHYGGRKWAVDVKTATAYPMDTRGVQRMLGLPLDNIGHHDWTSDRRLPPRLPTPRPVAWVRSSLAPPKPEGPKRPKPEPTVRLERAPPLLAVEWWSAPRPPPPVTRLPGITSAHPGWQGDRYDEVANLKLAEIARIIRRDTKAALASGDLPAGLEVDVYIGHRALNAHIVRAPSSLALVDVETLPHVLEDPAVSRQWRPNRRLSATAMEVVDALSRLVSRYRQDRSDSQADYFDTNFYADVKFAQHVLLQAAYDFLTVERGERRRDVYLERSATAAASDAARLGFSAGLVAYELSDPSTARFQWVEFASDRSGARWPRRVLAEVDADRSDAVELVLGWAREFSGRKPNRRPRGRR